VVLLISITHPHLHGCHALILEHQYLQFPGLKKKDDSDGSWYAQLEFWMFGSSWVVEN
jgi:hypothetical protein